MRGYNTQTGEEELFECNRCGYSWTPKDSSTPPRCCPGCKSTSWRKPSISRECKRCGNIWETVNAIAKRCPKCGSLRWEEELNTHSCATCGHAWTGKKADDPLRCPACRSPTWNEGGTDGLSVNSSASDDEGDSTHREVLDMYRRGESCTKIALEFGLSFSDVFKVISEEYPMTKIRV